MIYQLFGVVLFFIGCTYRFNGARTFDTQIVRSLQSLFNRNSVLPFFQEIWFFGRTSFTIVTLVLLTSLNWKLGLTATLVFLVTVGIEHIVKLVFNRSRPFSTEPDISMLQPTNPTDPSFPSGDALRIWYLALILPIAAGESGLFLAGSILLAILVTSGRLIMGVHFLTDAIAGIGLGLLGAGTTLWLWNLLNIL
jgi:undecaprenyl-diphosphatase